MIYGAYRVSLSGLTSGDSQITCSPAGISVSMEFTWPQEVQDQYDMWLEEIRKRRDSESLYFGRDYDYIQTYLGIVDIAAFISEASPSYLHEGESAATKERKVRSRIQWAAEVSEALQMYSECLTWQCVANILGEITVCKVVPGGWNRFQDRDLFFSFVSDLEKIGRNDLNSVEVEFGIPAV